MRLWWTNHLTYKKLLVWLIEGGQCWNTKQEVVTCDQIYLLPNKMIRHFFTNHWLSTPPIQKSFRRAFNYSCNLTLDTFDIKKLQLIKIVSINIQQKFFHSAELLGCSFRDEVFMVGASFKKVWLKTVSMVLTLYLEKINMMSSTFF